MIRSFLFFAFLIVLSGPALAEAPAAPAPKAAEPSTRALAAELAAMVNMHTAMDSIFDTMSKNVYPLVQRNNPNKRQLAKKMVEDAMREAKNAHMKEIDGNTADIYAQSFTPDELQKLVEFYKTPAGQKMLKTMPGLNDKIMAANLETIKAVMRQAMASLADTLKKQGMKIPNELGY